MRIALAVDGTRGDVFPMLSLGEHLREAGHTAIVCGPPDFETACLDRGLSFRPMGVDVRAFLTREAEGIARGPLGFARAGKRYFDETVARQFQRLPNATADVDLILGAGVCFAGQSAAELHGIPYRFVTYCPLLLPSREHAPFVVPFTQTPPWVNQLLWRAMPLFGSLLIPQLNRWRRHLGLPGIRDLYAHLLSERPLLATEPLLADVPRDCPIPVTRIGFLHRPSGEALPEKLQLFLDSGPPPVYIGFGSMTDPNPQQTTRIALDAVADVGCRALISTGWAGLGSGPLPGDVMRVETVDHTRLFPRVAAVVHHGGAGTTTTAARAGAPQIVVPHGADQYYWGERVHRMGLAPPPLPRQQLEVEALALRLQATLDNESLAFVARDMGGRMRAAASTAPDPLAAID